MKRVLIAVFLVLALPVSAAVSEPGKQVDKQDKPVPVPVGERQFSFVRANLVSTFYHEFAHALIDQLDLAVLGQEEDAADVLSAVLLNRYFHGPALFALAHDTAFGFKADARAVERSGDGWAWWDEHGLDWQRYYTFVCLFYGADPTLRAWFARAMGLPGSRAERCGDEYALARASWGPVLDDISGHGPGHSLSFRSRARSARQQRAAEVIGTEVDRLNQSYALPETVKVTVRHCRADSSLAAFYTEGRRKITVCTEYIDDLYRQAPK